MNEPGRSQEPLTYRGSGVDIDEAARAVALVARRAATTARPGVLAGIGGFGGLFALGEALHRPEEAAEAASGTAGRDLVLVAGADGVGSKLKIAVALDRHDTVGIDCVAMNVNDILTQGAEPFFFLDYLAMHRVLAPQVDQIVAGLAQGCREAGCALLGGETAELPSLYAPGEYDLAGFAVGGVPRGRLPDPARVRAGDAVLGLPSSGLHSNGYSLARRVLLDQAGLLLTSQMADLGRTLGEELLEPTRIYVRPVLRLLADARLAGAVHGMAHITGGGLCDNPVRALPPGLGIELWPQAWPEPPIFQYIRRLGPVDEAEMRRAFNLGLGFLLIVAAAEADAAARLLAEAGQVVHMVGRVVDRPGVHFR